MINESNLAAILTLLVGVSGVSLIGVVYYLKENDRIIKTQRLIAEELRLMLEFDRMTHSSEHTPIYTVNTADEKANKDE